MKWSNITSICVGSVGVFINHVWGGLDTMFVSLVGFMVLDFITALVCGYKYCELDSRIAYLGITRKKMMILIMVAVSVIIDRILNADGVTRSLVIFYYISMEGLSLLETASKLNFPIPEEIKRALAQLNNKPREER